MNENVFIFNEVCFCDGWFYFSSAEFNGLFRWREGETKAEFICHFDRELSLSMNLHSHVIIDGRKLYFIPFTGTGISIFDLVSKKMQFVSITEDIGTAAKIAYAFIKEDSLYLIPTNNIKDFKVMDLKSKQLKVWNEIVDKIAGLDIEYYCDVFGAVVKNDELLISIFNTGVILKFNLDNNSFEKLYFENCKMGNISLIGEDFYLTTCDASIYKLNQNGEIILELKLEQNERYFFKICENESFLFAIPCFGKSIFMKKKDGDNWVCMKDLMPFDFIRMNKWEPMSWGHVNVGKKVFLFPKTCNQILLIEDNQIQSFSLKIDNSMNGAKKSLIERALEPKQIGISAIQENHFINLNDFISAILD